MEKESKSGRKRDIYIQTERERETNMQGEREIQRDMEIDRKRYGERDRVRQKKMGHTARE